MIIIIDTENKEKKQKENLRRKQEIDQVQWVLSEPLFYIPTAILLFVIFLFSPVGAGCRQILTNIS